MTNMENLDLNHLTENEKDLILSVVRRADQLKHKDENRISKMKHEIKELKMKGALKAGMDAEKSCARCRCTFGWFFDRGELCPKCKQKVCENCRLSNVFSTDEAMWICTLCKKQYDLDSMSGSWFYSKFQKNKRSNTNDGITESSFVKKLNRENGKQSVTDGEYSPRKESRTYLNEKALRRQTSSPDPDGESSDTQSMEAHHVPKRNRKLIDAQYPKDADKIMLLDLMGGPSIGPISIPNRDSEAVVVDTTTVDVHRVSSRRYSDTSSDDSDIPTSPQFSHRSESEYAPSESINSSFRSNSALSSDGRYTMVTDRESVISGISTAPPSMHGADTPVLLDEDSENAVSSKHSPILTQDSVHTDEASSARRESTQIGVSTVVAAQIVQQHQYGYNTHDMQDNQQSVKTIRISHRRRSSNESSSSEEHITLQDIHNGRKIGTRDYDSEVPTPKQEASREQSFSSGSSRTTKATSDNQDITGMDVTETIPEEEKHSKRKSRLDTDQENIPAGPPVSYTQTNIRNNDDKNSGEVERKILSSNNNNEVKDTPIKSDVQPTGKTPKSEVAVVVVKQDSIISRASELSVPSVHVTDVSQTAGDSDEYLGEAEDDIDDLVDKFKHKSSHPNVHSPKHSNLLSSFSGSIESMTSIYSEAGEGNYGNIPVEGDIQFSLDYNYKASALEIQIKQCKDLAAVDTKKKRSDPYVKTYLLPDRTKSGKRKTRVKKHTLNPIFHETLKYRISKSELETRTLWVTVWHNDTFGRNDFLGEVTVNLDYYDFKDTSPKWFKLQERIPSQTSLLTYKGDINIALKYVTADNVSSTRKIRGKVGNKGELQVLVKHANNLTAVRSNGSSDPFCKAYLLPEKNKANKQKTAVIKGNCNPKWKHTFIFEDIGLEELKDRTLELTIWDHDRFTSNDFLGGVRLGLGLGRYCGKEADWCDSRGEEISIWQSMMDRTNYWIDATLLLRPNMNSKNPSA